MGCKVPKGRREESRADFRRPFGFGVQSPSFLGLSSQAKTLSRFAAKPQR